MQEFKVGLMGEPFPHAVIEEFYTEQELALIFRELEFLTAFQKMPKRFSTATVNGTPLSESGGIGLDEIYSKREISDILTINRKVFDVNLLGAFASLHPLMTGILRCNRDGTLIRYYENNQKYDGHFDTPRFTIASYFYKEPKAFDGGDLHFDDFDYTIPIKNNMVVVFMGSSLKHSSTEVTMKAGFPEFSGMGKYSMMQFLDTVAPC
jgi:hypothetical protein